MIPFISFSKERGQDLYTYSYLLINLLTKFSQSLFHGHMVIKCLEVVSAFFRTCIQNTEGIELTIYFRISL